MIYKFKTYIKEESSHDDPYNEENWDDDKENNNIDDKKKNNIYVIYVIGQDMNFLSSKNKRIFDKRRGWYEYEYIIATKTENGIHFNGAAIERNPYPVENREKIYTGEELVGYIQGFNMVRFDTLQNLCNIMGLPMNNVIMYG